MKKQQTYKTRNKAAKEYVTNKQRKEDEEIDERYIQEELEEYEKKKNGIS